MVIFHSYVSLPEGKHNISCIACICWIVLDLLVRTEVWWQDRPVWSDIACKVPVATMVPGTPCWRTNASRCLGVANESQISPRTAKKNQEVDGVWWCQTEPSTGRQEHFEYVCLFDKTRCPPTRVTEVFCANLTGFRLVYIRCVVCIHNIHVLIIIYFLIRVLIINHQNKIQPHQRYIVSGFFTLKRSSHINTVYSVTIFHYQPDGFYPRCSQHLGLAMARPEVPWPVPRKVLGDTPFIALVPPGLSYCAAGGGGFYLGPPVRRVGSWGGEIEIL